MVGGGVTNSWVGGVVVRTSGGRAVGGGVPYSGVGGVLVQASRGRSPGRAVGGGVTYSVDEAGSLRLMRPGA